MANGQSVTKAELLAALAAQSKDFLAALTAQSKEIRADFHAALTAQSKELRTEFRAALTAQSKELRTEFRAALSAQKDELIEFMRQIETNLLTEFHRYAKAQQVRLHTLESNGSDLVLRLATIEDRLLALESRRPPTPFSPSQPR